MVRLTVPDDYERGYVSVAGRKDFSYNNGADVNTDAVDNARGLSVREDEDGRYVGCSKHYAEDVAEFLDVDVPESAYPDEDGEVCGAELSQGGTCDRLASECPYHDTGGSD